MLRLTFLSLAVLGFFLVGCGSKSGSGTPANGVGPTSCASSSVLGTYQGVNSGYYDTLTLNSNCSGTSSYCNSAFTFTPASGSSGSFQWNVTSAPYAGDAGCPSTGNAYVSFQINGNQVTLYFADGSSATYSK